MRLNLSRTSRVHVAYNNANHITRGTSSCELYYSATEDVDDTAIRSGTLCEFRDSDILLASTSTNPVQLRWFSVLIRLAEDLPNFCEAVVEKLHKGAYIDT